MPQPKRRKLSLDEHDGKECDHIRICSGLDENAEKQTSGNAAAGQGKETSGSQSDKRTQNAKSERKTEMESQSSASLLSSSCDDGKDGVMQPSSAGDGCGRVSSSGRVIKQTKKGRSFSAALEAAQNKQSTTGQGVCNTGQGSSRAPVGKPTSTTPIRRKSGQKRSRDLWSKFEQDAFFEGLFEHGKDFDAIHNLLVCRSRKRGIDTAVIKTKEQVRHLYYRMWSKISKHVHMDNDVKKETQEIYGLVNYYAIRKIFKRLDQRGVEHLNELIHTGVSKVREYVDAAHKKRTRRYRVLRTPVCNALKKLNNIVESKEEALSDLPQQVTVELTPRSSAAWLKVHNLSHNPRVRFQVSVNRSVASLLEYLKKKWTGPHDRLRSSLGEAGEEDELVVFPHHSYDLKKVTLYPQRPTSVDLITFANYRENVLGSPPAGSRSSKKSGDDRQGGENTSDGDAHAPSDTKPVKSSVKINLLQKLSDPVAQVPQPPCEDENAMFPDAPLFSPPSKDDSTCAMDSFGDGCWATNSNCDSEEKAGDPSPDTSPVSKERSRECREEEKLLDMRPLVQSAIQGFTRQTSKLTTLSQLFLVLGKCDHIKLEYDWRPNWTAPGSSSVVGDVERLTNMLRRLSSLANLEYRDITQKAKVMRGGTMSQCTLCGHSLEKVNTRKKMTSDVATETDPSIGLSDVAMMHPAQFNSNGTLVGMASKSAYLQTLQAPDTDGVFRVPMPLAMPMSVRAGQPQRLGNQSPVGQLIRPPETRPRPNFMLPRKKKQKKKLVVSQRTLLPKPPPSSVILVPQNLLQPVSSSDNLGMEGSMSHNLGVSVDGSVSHNLGVSVDGSVSHSLGVSVDGSISHNLAVSVESSMSHNFGVSVEGSMSHSLLTTLPPIDPHCKLDMGDSGEASVISTMPSVQELDTGMPTVSVANLLGEHSASSSDPFACQLDMPVIVSPQSSPVKSSHQLISSSVSPPSLSSMLDISLPAPSNQAGDAGDKFLEMVASSSSGFSGLLKPDLKECQLTESGSQVPLDNPQHTLSTPQHVMHTLSTPQHVMHTSPTGLHSPFKQSPLKLQGEAQWLNTESWGFQVPEFSLSEFEDSPVKKSGVLEDSNSVDLHAQSLSLSRFLQSPVKKSDDVSMPTLSAPSTSSSSLSSTSFIPAPPSLFGESSQDSLVTRLDVDTAIQSVMMESSIDYSSKFENLAAHLAESNDVSQPNM